MPASSSPDPGSGWNRRRTETAWISAADSEAGFSSGIRAAHGPQDRLFNPVGGMEAVLCQMKVDTEVSYHGIIISESLERRNEMKIITTDVAAGRYFLMRQRQCGRSEPTGERAGHHLSGETVSVSPGIRRRIYAGGAGLRVVCSEQRAEVGSGERVFFSGWAGLPFLQNPY